MHLTSREQQMLTAICDTLAPSLAIAPDPDGFYARKASDLGVNGLMEQAITEVSDPTNRFLARVALVLLGNPLGNWITGSIHKSFLEMTLDERTTLLQRWSVSPLPMLRRAFQGFKRLALFFFYTAVDERGVNPNWPTLHYDGPPPTKPAQPDAEPTIKPLRIYKDTVLHTDVVIVGSGAGGGVVAGELTAAGLDVIVLEKGGYYAESDFHGRELSSTQQLFENQGLLTTSDLGVVILAGSTLGGGTTINWSASLRPHDWVLTEWAREYGATTLTGSDFQNALDAVSARLNVNTDECAVNPQNAVLETGAVKLGYDVGTIPRNVKGCGDCGFCNYGCALGSKQSTLKTYLQDASQRGARIIVNAAVNHVTTSAGQATGIEATTLTPDGSTAKVTVKAKAVVVAAGSLHTPVVLLRSGLTNANIGRNLHLHPTTPIYGLYDHAIRGWSGPIMTRVVTQFNNLDSHGYGVVLETAPVHPGIAALALSWKDGLQHKTVMSHLESLANTIIITRDYSAGHITVNREGKPAIAYQLTETDRAHMMHGIIEALKVQAAAGANEVCAPHVYPHTYQKASSVSFDDYLASVQNDGLRLNEFALLSAHQMSSCRMAANPARGAVNPAGETFEVRNLFVADGSVLPTATGVNPMLTIMGAAYVIASQIKTRLGK